VLSGVSGSGLASVTQLIGAVPAGNLPLVGNLLGPLSGNASGLPAVGNVLTGLPVGSLPAVGNLMSAVPVGSLPVISQLLAALPV
jgi:hypothetical protein